MSYDECQERLAGDALGADLHSLGRDPEPEQIFHGCIASLSGELEVRLHVSGLGSIASDDQVILRPSL